MGNAVLDTDPPTPCRYPRVMTTLEESGTDRSLLDRISDAYPTDPRAQQVVMSMGAPREEQPDWLWRWNEQEGMLLYENKVYVPDGL
jgi:hypothetical protein